MGEVVRKLGWHNYEDLNGQLPTNLQKNLESP